MNEFRVHAFYAKNNQNCNISMRKSYYVISGCPSQINFSETCIDNIIQSLAEKKFLSFRGYKKIRKSSKFATGGIRLKFQTASLKDHSNIFNFFLKRKLIQVFNVLVLLNELVANSKEVVFCLRTSFA